MSHILHVVDAFTDQPFAGNPAAVCVLDGPADETWMKLVAREMNLSETAFLWPVESAYSLRWLTPSVEVKICGHATLASAFTLWETGVLKPDEVARFDTLSGRLTCRREGDWIEMDFPANIVEPSQAPEGLQDALGCDLKWVGRSALDYLVEVADETVLRSIRPDFKRLATLPVRGVIVTSRSWTERYDFVSRFFGPGSGIDEDPATGSSHCALGSYWQRKLKKDDFTAYQASARGGTVRVGVRGNRILLRGQAVLMSRLELRH